MSDQILSFTPLYEGYLTDESLKSGSAESISFPESEEDVRRILASLPANMPLTVQGSRTGLKGLAVPHGGHVMNLSRMNRIRDIRMVSEEEGLAEAEPGVLLEQLERELPGALRAGDFFWPPSPTEKTASIGGIAATGAAGMNVCRYGETWQYVESVRAIRRDGTLQTAADAEQIRSLLDETKNGTVLVSLQLRLLRRPSSVWGIAFFFQDAKAALACADTLRTYQPPAEDAYLMSLEFVDAAGISLVESSRELLPQIRAVQSVPDGTQGMLYVETGGSETATWQTLSDMMPAAAACGADPDTAWAFRGRTEAEKMHDFRHAVTEAVNRFIVEKHAEDPRIVRVSTDRKMTGAVSFAEAAVRCRKELEEQDLRAVICAHIRPTELAVMLLPDNADDVQRGETLIRNWETELQK